MKRLSFLAMFIAMILGASAQQYMHVWSDGAWVSWPVLNVDSITFTDGPLENVPDEPQEPIQGIGVFSVGEGKKVTFSPGNLQYTQSTNTWSFASAQWEMLGTDNVIGGSVTSDPIMGDSKEGSSLADKIDLFGWSTSATRFGVSTSIDNNDYSGSFVDWGTNTIGTDAPNTWRTLTKDEWEYLRYNRTNADNLLGIAQVNGVNGLIFLPDNWICPAGVTFKSGFHSSYGAEYYAAYQTFTAEQWSLLESAGAVFLPATGHRVASEVIMVQHYSYFWTATESSDNALSWYFYFASGGAGMQGTYRFISRCVRLVKDVEGETTEPGTPPANIENGHEYVDLGLSVKWATCNVGANAPEESGDYFAWGETQTKSTYDWGTYKWCNGSPYTLTKYCTDSDCGTVDNKTILDKEDDAAAVNWGGSWRMPSDDELTELRTECTWTWTTQNGVNGYIVTGPNGNSIFLPTAGVCLYSNLNFAGSDGWYWSSSLRTVGPYNACSVYFDSNSVNWNTFDRCYGQSVRPVCE